MAIGLGLFLVLEIVARCWLALGADEPQFKRFAPRYWLLDRESENEGFLPYEPRNYTGYAPAPQFRMAQNRGDNHGFREDKAPPLNAGGRTRIVCMGGSTTFGSWLTAAQAYPAQLSAELLAQERDVQVFNAGAEGYSSYESLITYAFRSSAADPDIVIIYHAINDLFARIVWPPEHYTSDNMGLRAPYFEESTFILLTNHCMALRIPLIALGLMDPVHDVYGVFAPRAHTWRIFDWAKALVRGKPALFDGVSLKDVLAANSPDHFEANLRHLIAMIRADGAQPVLVTFVHLPLHPTLFLLSSKEFQAGLEEMNEVVRKVARETESPLFDAVTVYPREEANFVKDEGIHFSAEGAMVMGRLVADFLIKQGLI
jgi:lysophospholipase L1-like esterase